MEYGLLTASDTKQEVFRQPEVGYGYDLHLLKHKFQQELFKQMDKFISALSHDIKPPALAQIRVLEHLLSKSSQEELGTEQKTLLQMTLDSCYEQYDIINDLINSLKYQRQEVLLTYNSFNIVELLMKCVSNFLDANREIKIDTNSPSILISADEDKISEAIFKSLKYVIGRSLSNSAIHIEAFENRQEQSITIKISEIMPMSLFSSSSLTREEYRLCPEDYNSVGSNQELELIEKVVMLHNGRFRREECGNRQSVELILPKEVID